MLFSEIYGCYFQAVSAILTEAVSGTLTDHRLTDLVQQKAFAESVLSIPTALKQGDWPLLDTQNQTPLHFAPTMPLTTLQKRWLKTLLQDPALRCSLPSLTGFPMSPLYMRRKPLSFSTNIQTETPIPTPSISRTFRRFCLPSTHIAGFPSASTGIQGVPTV